MTIEEYLQQLRALRRALMRANLRTGDRRGHALLKQWVDVRVCVSPPHHRPYWYHAGGQHYVCEICAIAV